MRAALGRLLGVVGIVLLVLASVVGPAEAQTTTTTSPADRAAACSWEWGGQSEATPAKCDDLGEIGLPDWLLVACAVGVFLGGAALIGSWRR